MDSLPIELIYHLVKYPTTFFNLMLVSRTNYQICNYLIECKNTQFTKHIVTETEDYYLYGGLIHGCYKEYYYKYDNDKIIRTTLKKKYNYKKGKLEGLCETFYANGLLWRRFYCQNGNYNGSYESWYSNGRREIKATMSNGEYIGLYHAWTIHGRLIEECIIDEEEGNSSDEENSSEEGNSSDEENY